MDSFTELDEMSDAVAEMDSIEKPREAAHVSSSLVAKFVEQADRKFRRDEIASFWECETEFRALLATDFAAEVFNQELRELALQPGRLGDWRPGQLMVHRGRSFALSIALFEQTRRYVHTTPFFGMYAPVGASGLNYELYKLPSNYQNEVFDPAIKLQHIGSGIVVPGDVLLLRSDQYVYDFKVEAPQVVAKFTTAPFQTMEWLFNKENLHAWQANDSELCSTQLRVAAYLLGRLAHQSSLEPLNLLAGHPNHSVRWAALQNLGRLSRTAAVKKLNEAVNDPHPHVRRAAAKTLQQLK